MRSFGGGWPPRTRWPVSRAARSLRASRGERDREEGQGRRAGIRAGARANDQARRRAPRPAAGKAERSRAGHGQSLTRACC